ncbi:hypothetical protein GP486_006510 [Trichoglossum hirsutum]|uniref:GAF domain-containing protein n=1 Tax=Trichoglossum hirsutum TaxID=265104 RepID=A0A9P8I7Z7_9PEZI|nr:hypothetical protein GP486_006510 [Trichoglossum hirsutum]
MVGSRSLKLKRSFSRIAFRQDKGGSTDHPPVPPLDADDTAYGEPVFERPIYLQPLAARSLSESASTSRRTSAASPSSVPTSPTRTGLFSRSIDLLAAHQTLARAQQRNNGGAEKTDLFPDKVDLLAARQVVMRQEPEASPAKSDKMFTQAKMVLVEQDTLDRSGFLKRIFSRQNRSSKEQNALEQSQSGGADPGHNDSVIPKMGPSPHTHPLLSKPYARDEFVHTRPQGSKPLESSLSVARRKGELALATRSASMRSITRGVPESNDSHANLPEPKKNDSEAEEAEVATETVPTVTTAAEAAPVAAAPVAAAAANSTVEVGYGQEWNFFVRCYAEGRFNISNPPDPPPRPSDFNHLIAPTPPNETERLRAVEQINLNYPRWASSKAEHLVQLATKVFGTSCASISFVDSHNEVMKAECGYQTSIIPRDSSIGAHVLLSTDSMVILDTKKDWRLQDNPLVTGAPQIRFYAGAPLTTPEGHVVGVFAIFDTKPLTDFPLPLRRKLVDLTKIASSDIEILIEEQRLIGNKDGEETPKHKSSGAATGEGETAASSGGTNKLTTKLLKNIEEESRQAQVVGSVGTEAGTSSVQDVISHDLFVRGDKSEEAQSDFPEPRNVSNKPQNQTWNASSTVAITPPQTPSRTSAASNESSLLKQTVSTPSGTNRSLSLSSDYDRPYVSRKHRKNMPRALKDTSKLGLKLDTHDDQQQQHPRSPGPVSSLTEAGFALSLIAGTLNYDLVYLLRVRPNPSWKGTEFTEFDSLSTRILVAHGLPKPEPVFDPFIHLRALRSEGGVIYQNPNQASSGADDDLGYGVGVLLPLLRDGVDELPLICTTDADGAEQEDAERKALTAAKIEAYSSCKGGVVLAAFKKQPSPGHDFSNEEVAYLREMGRGMKDIFIKGDILASPTPAENEA